MTRRLIHESQSVDEALDSVISKEDISEISKGDFDRGVISTGSTLLDLSISGGRVYGGGIPAGVIIEIYGPSSSGKTAVLAEIAASTEYHGGDNRFLDPEARLDTVYAKLCGLNLTEEQYFRPDTIEELFDLLEGWKPQPKTKDAICSILADSLAAFTTIKEMTDGDKMAAARRAAGYHAGLRKFGRLIANNGWIIACSNQEQDSFTGSGKTTPGGNAWKYWASIRMRVAKAYPNGDITKTWKISSATVSKTIGIRSTVKIIKNSVDDPFREVPIFIIFGRGIDDVRGNLQWIKEIEGSKTYNCIDKEFAMIDAAIRYIEENNLELKLRESVIRLWSKIEDHFKTERKPKVRF